MKIVLLSSDNREILRRYGEPDPIIPPPQEALLQGFAKLPEADVHMVSCVQQPVKSPERLAWGSNIYYHSVDVPKLGWMRTLYQGCIRAVRKKMREIQPDIVHGQGTERDCAISAVFSGFPNVLTIHGNMRALAAYHHSRPASFLWLAARLEQFALPRTTGVFCNSAYTEGLVAPVARKVWRVPNPIRLPFFDAPMEAAVRRPILLNVGVLASYKRQREILALARNLWRRGMKFEIHFAGSRGDRNDYGGAFARELAEAEQAGYARHLGNLDTAGLIAAMNNATAMIHAPTQESFGLVVAEGLARNLKLFGSATGGMMDIAQNVDGAELFPPHDWDAMEESITRWINHGCPRPATAAAAMRERYHPDVIARQHLEIYREVLSAQ